MSETLWGGAGEFLLGSYRMDQLLERRVRGIMMEPLNYKEGDPEYVQDVADAMNAVTERRGHILDVMLPVVLNEVVRQMDEAIVEYCQENGISWMPFEEQR